jgi:uncharacterized protein (DUF1684 family)
MRERRFNTTLSSRAVAAALLASVLLLSACSSQPADPAAQYAQVIATARAHKDEAFRNQPNEPVPPAQYDQFLPLKYFPPDQDYQVPASFKPSASRTPVKIPTSTGKLRDMEVVGTLEFTLKGQKLSVLALTEVDTPPDRLFVPFTDATSGTETYSAGRYLEIERSTTGIYVIDFNLAFHPFCYYNSTYDCPYPPAQNRLPLPIRAGEKMGRAAALPRLP